MLVHADAGPPLVVPGTVGVAGQKAVWTRLIATAVCQRELKNFCSGANIEGFLQRQREKVRL